MPTISWFYGIATRMYYVDHPPPHFEAAYGEHQGNVSIETGEVIEGRRRGWSSSGRLHTNPSCSQTGIAPVLKFHSKR
jgi:hypothetical protein